ncbi:uncharacterized protein LOC129913918 [Episyrphus balteatus]|uniref:uncharacterized protein LOC129913918 n=1 Tax=Episyrphus balteatus TaxID=286459 RepID=UPI002486CCAA|nr:uncharacterized protein LOC129913918 [Episyrphus balteatus]
MYLNRSPPSHKKPLLGGSTESLTKYNKSGVTSGKLHHHHHHHHHHQHQHNQISGSSSSAATTLSTSASSMYSSSSTTNLMAGSGSGSHLGGNVHPHSHSRVKRNKKNSWGARERAGMSFLIVIAFFAVFGLIILTELFMIDEKSHGGMVVLRHGNLGSRLGDSLPDYDNVKEDYDLLDGSLLMSDNKLGIFQFHSDNKLKIHDRLSMGISNALNDDDTNSNEGANAAAARQAVMGGPGNGAIGAGVGGQGVGAGAGAGAGINNVQAIPWGKMLPEKIEQTLPHYPIGMRPTDGSWQVVNGTRFKFFVFSAYYDRRDGAKLVRVIGATKTRGPERVWCRFWYTYRDANNHTRYNSATVMARVKVIRENWNLKYSACFVLCPLRTAELNVPQSVSIVSRLRAPPGNILRVRNTDQDPDFTNRTATSPSSSSSSTSSSSSSSSPVDQIADKIAICVKPFHFNYDQALYLMEYLEFNSLLGVSHFTFYNHTLGSRATCVLNHYIEGTIPANLTAADADKPEFLVKESSTPDDARSSHGANNTRKYESTYTKPTVTILPWDLRMRSQKEIRTEGLFAALNDCLYRNMYRYRYLALVDLDEFIIPRHGDTLNELINWLDKRYKNRNAGAYSFQNAFFYLQFQDDPWLYDTKSANQRLRAALVTQRKTRRRSKLHPQKQRSKYICRPETVVEAGNHFVWEFSPGKGSLNVPPDAGILHHYRVCEFGGNDCIKSPSIVDRTATRYVNRLVERVESVYNYLKKPCDLPDLPLIPEKPPPEPVNEPKYKPIIRKDDKSNIRVHPKLYNKIPKDEDNDTNNNDLTNLNAASIPSETAAAVAPLPENEAPPPTEIKRKVIVFEQDSNGQTKVRVKYVT